MLAALCTHRMQNIKTLTFLYRMQRFGRVFPSLQLVCSSLCLCVLTSGSCEFCWSSICSPVDWAPGLEPKSPAWPKITTLHPHAPFRRAYSFGICFMLLHSCFQFLLSSWSKLVDGLSWSLLFHMWKFNLRKHVGLCKLWETLLLMHQQKPSPQNFAFKINVPITQSNSLPTFEEYILYLSYFSSFSLVFSFL